LVAPECAVQGVVAEKDSLPIFLFFSNNAVKADGTQILKGTRLPEGPKGRVQSQ
jgi:hypothetical protein